MRSPSPTLRRAPLDLPGSDVRIAPGDGEPVLVPQDSAKPCAAGAEGWQFSQDKKKYCFALAHAPAKSGPSTKFTVGFGCNTEVR